MLSFKINTDDTVSIYCDVAGIATLLETIGRLVRDNDHIHLRGPSAGGADLAEVTPYGESAASEVVFDYLAELYEPKAE